MKKLLVIVVVSMFLASNVFAGGVTDNNDGNAGNILMSTGENNGANSIGTWVDASEFKGEKGDTGETGATGATGPQGEQGIQGEQGPQGEQGIQGETGQAGLNGLNGENGTNGKDGEKGSTGEKGQQGVRGATGKGLKDRAEVLIGARIYEGRRWTTEVHVGHDFNNDVNILPQIRFTRAFGKSYTEKRLDEIEAKLDAIQSASYSEVYTTENGVGIREKK